MLVGNDVDNASANTLPLTQADDENGSTTTETAINALVDSTELLNNNTSDDKQQQQSNTADDAASTALLRKHAWVQDTDALAPASSTSIFAFVPKQAHECIVATTDVAVPTAITPSCSTSTSTITNSSTTASTTHASTTTAHPLDSSVAIQIDPLVVEHPRSLALTHTLEAEKAYTVPRDLPDFGWFDCFQLGASLTYTTMLLRRNLSPQLLHLGCNDASSLSSAQLRLVAHAGVAFNQSTQSVTIGEASPGKQKTTLLHRRCVGDNGAIALFRALRVNTALRSLTLQHVGLSDASMAALAATLRCNTTLTSLSLAHNHIGPHGIDVLSDALDDSPDSMLLQLDLHANAITDVGMTSLRCALRENETLVTIDVSANRLSPVAILGLLNALRDNFVLRDVALYAKDSDGSALNISERHERAYAARLAAALLALNPSVECLQLTSRLANLPLQTLQHSRVVVLRHANLQALDALVLAGVLPRNRKLQTLDLSDNPHIERAAIFQLLTSIQRCQTLQHVVLVNVGVFADAAERVGELVAANETLQSITMHATALPVQHIRGHGASVPEALTFDVHPTHHCDRWILIKCFALNRVTRTLNGLCLPPALPTLPATISAATRTQLGLNVSGRPLDVYEVVFFATKLQYHRSVQRLALNSCAIEGIGAAALAAAAGNHAALATLELEHNALGRMGGLALLASVPHNVSLTALNLSWNQIGTTSSADDVALATAFQHALSTNRTLERLELRGNGLHASAIEALSIGLRRNASLVVLSLRWNPIDARGATALADALRINKTLRTLDVAFHTMESAGASAIAAMLAVNTTLETLDMHGCVDTSDWTEHNTCGIGEDAAQCLAAALATSNHSLTCLNVAQNAIGASGVAAFSEGLKSTTSTLVALDLSHSAIDATLAQRFFACLRMNSTLQQLRLAHNRIQNDGMLACLTALQTNGTLVELDVRANRITEESFATLLALLTRPTHSIQLRWLCVAENTMTPRTFAALKALRTTVTLVLEATEGEGERDDRMMR